MASGIEGKSSDIGLQNLVEFFRGAARGFAYFCKTAVQEVFEMVLDDHKSERRFLSFGFELQKKGFLQGPRTDAGGIEALQDGDDGAAWGVFGQKSPFVQGGEQ